MIDNGNVINKIDNVVVGHTVNYQCNEGHFAYGDNSDQLSTTCLNNRTYSLEQEDLATCSKIGYCCCVVA